MKKLILLISLLTTINTFSQGGILTLNVYQDQRLLWVGDDKGNSSGTINALIRSEWQGNPSELGYLFVYPQFEIADLAGGTYRRYSAGAVVFPRCGNEGGGRKCGRVISCCIRLAKASPPDGRIVASVRNHAIP